MMGTSHPTPWLRSDLQQLLVPSQHLQTLGLRPTGSKNSVCRAAQPICAVREMFPPWPSPAWRASARLELEGVVSHQGSAEGTLGSPTALPRQRKSVCRLWSAPTEVLAFSSRVISSAGFSHLPSVFQSLISTTRRFQLLAPFPCFLVSTNPWSERKAPWSWRKRDVPSGDGHGLVQA